MKKSLVALAAVVAAGVLPSASYADVAFNAGVVTDYRYRGISQTRLKPALQGGIDYSNGGFYLGTWASTIKWIKDAGGDANVEIDLYGGYKGEIAKDFGYDVGLLTYVYPSNKLPVSANTTEIYGALTYGPVTAKYSHSTTNLFGFGDSKGSGYLDLSGTFEVMDGWSLTPHLGYQKVKNNGDFSYTDYALTLSKDFKGLVFSVALIGTDTKKIDDGADEGGAALREMPMALIPAYSSPVNGKNMGKAGIVLGLKYNF